MSDKKSEGKEQITADIPESTKELSKRVSEAYNYDLRLRLMMVLMIYRELSLAQMAKILNKSKSTISRHTRSLIDNGFIKSFTKENEVQPGNIKRNYYKLVRESFIPFKKIFRKEYFSKFEEPNKLLEILLSAYSFQKGIYFLLGGIIEMLHNFADELADIAVSGSNDLEKLRTIGEKFLALDATFLTEKQFKQYQSIRREFDEKLDKIKKDDDGTERPYLVFELPLPIKTLLESKK